MKNLITRFVSEEDGATMVEYALMVALIAIAALVAAQTLGGKISGAFTQISEEIPATGG